MKVITVVCFAALIGVAACSGAGPSAAPSGALPQSASPSTVVAPTIATSQPSATGTPTPDLTPTPDPTPTLGPTASPSPSPDPQPSGIIDLHLASDAFAGGEPIPTEYTCDGADLQLPIEWSGVPTGTVELALVMHDPQAGGFVHWVVAGIPSTADELLEELPEGARHGLNDFGSSRYDGPCPPSGTHTYFFTLFALSAHLDVGDAPTARDVRQAAQEVTIARAELRGTYRRTP